VSNQAKNSYFSSDYIQTYITRYIIRHTTLHKHFHIPILTIYSLLWTFPSLIFVYDWIECSIRSAFSHDSTVLFLLIIYNFHSFLHSTSSSTTVETISMKDGSLLTTKYWFYWLLRSSLWVHLYKHWSKTYILPNHFTTVSVFTKILIPKYL